MRDHALAEYGLPARGEQNDGGRVQAQMTLARLGQGPPSPFPPLPCLALPSLPFPLPLPLLPCIGQRRRLTLSSCSQPADSWRTPPCRRLFLRRSLRCRRRRCSCRSSLHVAPNPACRRVNHASLLGFPSSSRPLACDQ